MCSLSLADFDYIFIASKLEVPTLNKISSFLHDRDFKEMDKIVTKQINLNFDRRKTLYISDIFA
jgi:hypothetical protein